MIDPWILLVLFAAFGTIFFFVARRISPSEARSTGDAPFTVDVSHLAEKEALEPFSGREAEIDRVIHIIMRRSKNNPLLIGNPGVGKTAIVHGLAERMHHKNVPSALIGKRVLALDLGAIMAGSQYRGELEKRLQSLLSELEKDPRHTILFIDEVHMIAQASGTEGALNVSDILKPALSRGDLQIIGATTWEEYEKYIRPDAAFDRRFQPVLVDEPSPKDAIQMLKAIRHVYEDFHHVSIPDNAIEAAVKLSDKKIRGRYLPDKAIDLIDEASAKVAIESSRHQHGKHLGVVHAAAKATKEYANVSVKDIQDVVDQWVIHSKESKRRDARSHE
ncbi:MAG: AAA family ATPase [Patescibacteria group bacterium]